MNKENLDELTHSLEEGVLNSDGLLSKRPVLRLGIVDFAYEKLLSLEDIKLTLVYLPSERLVNGVNLRMVLSLARGRRKFSLSGCDPIEAKGLLVEYGNRFDFYQKAVIDGRRPNLPIHVGGDHLVIQTYRSERHFMRFAAGTYKRNYADNVYNWEKDSRLWLSYKIRR